MVLQVQVCSFFVGQVQCEAVSTTMCGRKMRSKQCPMQSSTLWNVTWPSRWLSHSDREVYRPTGDGKTTAPSHVPFCLNVCQCGTSLEFLVRARCTLEVLYVSLLEVRMKRQRLDDRFR